MLDVNNTIAFMRWLFIYIIFLLIIMANDITEEENIRATKYIKALNEGVKRLKENLNDRNTLIKLVKVYLVDWYLLGRNSPCPKSELNIPKEVYEEFTKHDLVDENDKMTDWGKEYASRCYDELINKLSLERGLEYYTWVEARSHYLGLPMPLSSPHLFK